MGLVQTERLGAFPWFPWWRASFTALSPEDHVLVTGDRFRNATGTQSQAAQGVRPGRKGSGQPISVTCIDAPNTQRPELQCNETAHHGIRNLHQNRSHALLTNRLRCLAAPSPCIRHIPAQPNWAGHESTIGFAQIRSIRFCAPRHSCQTGNKCHSHSMDFTQKHQGHIGVHAPHDRICRHLTVFT